MTTPNALSCEPTSNLRFGIKIASLTLRALGEGGIFQSPMSFSDVQSFSTGNFVAFPDIKCRVRTK